MDEIRALIWKKLEHYEATPITMADCVEGLLKALKPYLKGPPVRVIEPEALKAWVDGTLSEYTEKGA